MKRSWEKRQRRSNSPAIRRRKRILQIEEELAFHGNQQREIKEAINAGNCALRIAEKILEDLDSAKKWSTVDLLGGDLIADMAKHDKINKVQDRIQDLQNALRGFRTKLADVTERISGDLYVEIGDFLHFADYFFSTDCSQTGWYMTGSTIHGTEHIRLVNRSNGFLSSWGEWKKKFAISRRV